MWRVSFLIDWNTKRFAGGIRLPITVLQSKTTLRSILDTFFPTPRRSYPDLFLLVEYTFPPGDNQQAPGESFQFAAISESLAQPHPPRSLSPASELALSQAGLSLEDSTSMPGHQGGTDFTQPEAIPSSPPALPEANPQLVSSSSSLLSSILVLPGPPNVHGEMACHRIWPKPAPTPPTPSISSPFVPGGNRGSVCSYCNSSEQGMVFLLHFLPFSPC